MNKHLNILIIDDTKSKYIDIRDTILSICSQRNIEVTIVNKSAINPALYHLYYENRGNNRYDFIFVDRILPRWEGDMNHLIYQGGVEILEEMERKRDATPVILCSSESFDVKTTSNVIGCIKYSPVISLHSIIDGLLFKEDDNAAIS